MDVRAAILGTGPSAAYAVAACKKYLVPFDVYSNRTPVYEFPGPFWLRLNPTFAPVEKRPIHIWSVGDKETYLKKQWDKYEIQMDWSTVESSFPTEAREEMVFEPKPILTDIWSGVQINFVHSMSDDEVRQIAAEYTIVFMTFPTENSKNMMKAYSVRYPIITYDYPFSIDHNSCVYIGNNNNGFVRYSHLFGKLHFEYPYKHVINFSTIGEGSVSHAPDTFPGAPEWDPKDVPASNVILVGRHAQWKRKVLSHDAYQQVMTELDKLQFVERV